jgi:hypothetical protein
MYTSKPQEKCRLAIFRPKLKKEGKDLEVSKKLPIFAADNLYPMPQRECSMTARGT